jgi:hypothetical protein
MLIMKAFAILACLALQSCAAASSQGPGADGLVPYAQVKASSRQIVSRDTLKWTCRTRFPIRGVVVSDDSFLTSRADFYMIDIDARTVRRIMIDREPVPVGAKILNPKKTVVWVDESTSLSSDELNPVIRRMNQIWRNGVSDKPELQPLDSSPDLVLLDAGLAFNDSGTFNRAPDKVLNNAVFNLARQYKLTLTRGVSTGVPCDPDSTP